MLYLYRMIKIFHGIDINVTRKWINVTWKGINITRMWIFVIWTNEVNTTRNSIKENEVSMFPFFGYVSVKKNKKILSRKKNFFQFEMAIKSQN